MEQKTTSPGSLLTDTSNSQPTAPAWTFLTNHTHVIVCLSRDPAMTVRKLALQVGITDRSVQRILADLEAAGVVTRLKKGRCNRYALNFDFQLRHPLESQHTLKDLLEAVR